MSSTATKTPTRPPMRPSLSAQQRRRHTRRRAVKRTLIGPLVLGLVAGLVWLVGFSPVLDTRSVAVSGTRILSADRVRIAAGAPLGRPLVRQDTGAIRNRVAALPPVESVTVTRSWPRTLSVAVVERTPLLAVRDGSGYALIDKAGVAFQTVAAPPAGVIRTDIDRSDAALLVQAGTVAAGLPAELRKRTANISATSPDSFRVAVDSGLVVTWGTPADSSLKGQITLALLAQKPKAIDVSAPHSPAVR